jgi:hypothetical protein
MSERTSSLLSSLVEALDRFPDPRYGSRAISELLPVGFAGKAVPDLYEPGWGPVCREFGQCGFVAESFGVGERFGFLRRPVNHNIVHFVLNPEGLHFQSPGAASAAIGTLIAPVADTSKRIPLVRQRILPANGIE